MDPNSNVNLKVVQGDFPIKYGPKLLNTYGQSLKIPFNFISKLKFLNTIENPFFTLGSAQTENTQIRAFAYFQFNHFLKYKMDSESRFEMRISIF